MGLVKPEALVTTPERLIKRMEDEMTATQQTCCICGKVLQVSDGYFYGACVQCARQVINIASQKGNR